MPCSKFRQMIGKIFIEKQFTSMKLYFLGLLKRKFSIKVILSVCDKNRTAHYAQRYAEFNKNLLVCLYSNYQYNNYKLQWLRVWHLNVKHVNIQIFFLNINTDFLKYMKSHYSNCVSSEQVCKRRHKVLITKALTDYPGFIYSF